MKNPMTLFVMFALNYPPNFIEDCFGQRIITQHLLSKWASLDGYDGYAKMVRFWSLMSDDNRDTLYNWILENYKG
jgi:hypothetical protein